MWPMRDVRMRGTNHNTFIFSIGFALGIALTIRWATHHWRSQMRMRSRAMLMVSVKSIVEQWEESCLREVREWIVLDNEKNREEDSLLLFQVHKKERDCPFHGSLRSIAYAPGLDLSEWIRLWRLGRHLCVRITEDLLWISRLEYLLKYVAFRRLALMAEARYYAISWRYAVYGSITKDGQEPHIQVPMWLVGRQPFWMLSLRHAGVGKLLCLPLSYFPVEAILTHLAEETWVKDLETLLPVLTGQSSAYAILKSFEEIRSRYAFKIVHQIIEEKYPTSWKCLWKNIDRLFLIHAVPLLKGQLMRREKSCRRFYREKLFDGIALVTGEGVDVEEDIFFRDLKFVSGRDVLFRNDTVSRKIRRLLSLRVLSHAVRIGINLLAPRYNIFADWMLFSILSSAKSDDQRGTIISEYTIHILQSSLATLVTVLLTALDDMVKTKICDVIKEELTQELSAKLATTDEAFLRRFMEDGITGRENSVDLTFSYAENVAAQIMNRFDYEQRWHLTRILLFFVSLWRREADLAVLSLILSKLDFHTIAYDICCWCGVTLNRGLNYEVMSLEEKKFPISHRYGLQIMLDLLLEDNYKCNDPVKPYLSLIVCAGTLVFNWSMTIEETRWKNILHKLEYVNFIREFYEKIVKHIRDELRLQRLEWKLRGISIIENLIEDAMCVKRVVLKEYIDSIEAIVRKNSFFTTCKNSTFMESNLRKENEVLETRKLHSMLDSEENDLLQRSQTVRHIPNFLSFDDVFNKRHRFILRQLGIETIFAYKAATDLGQSDRRSIRESLVDLASGPFHNLFAQILGRIMEFTENVVIFAFLSQRNIFSLNLLKLISMFSSRSTFNMNSLILKKTDWGVISCLGHVSHYRVLLKEHGDSSFGPPFRRVQQLARYLPTTIHDVSPMHYAPHIVERRRVWKEVILMNREGVEFDDIGRICGGFFPLKKDIRLCGVYFVYPQLQHSLEDGSLQPSLLDIDIVFPEGEMTAVMGPTGSGKSTLLSLLKRMYDPVVAISNGMGNVYSWIYGDELAGLFRTTLDASFPLPSDETFHGNAVFIDGVPIWCFSTSYLRGAFGLLEQNPCVVEELSFHENISFFAPSLSWRSSSRSDALVASSVVSSAAKLSQCDVFIESRPLGYAAPVGMLSPGEKQRVALARALARFIGLLKPSGAGPRGVILLDEPTSRLDGLNEARIQETLARLREARGLTTIAVAHRLSTLKATTYAVILSRGQVEYAGPSKDLFSCSRFFQHQAALQEFPFL